MKIDSCKVSQANNGYILLVGEPPKLVRVYKDHERGRMVKDLMAYLDTGTLPDGDGDDSVVKFRR